MLPRVWHAVHERSATAIELPSDDLLEKLKALSRPDASPERGVEMSMDGTGIDLFPLTVPHGFGWRRDWAFLWADVISERAQTIRVSTGADWYMAWACNGRVVLDRTTPAGNEQPPSPLDHLVEIELRAGSNRIGVLVIAGMEGFCLHCQVAPADLEARQTRAVEERVHTARRRVEQLHHPARVQVDANRVVGTLPAPHQHASISLDMADDLTLTQAEAHWGRQQFVRAFAVIRDGFLMSDDYTPAPDDAHDRRLAAVARRADDIMYPLPMTGVTQVLSGQLDEATYVRRMARAMRHARAIAPQARWAEVFNESEVDRLSNIVEYYRFYRLACRAAADASRATPDLPIRMGGPSCCSFSVGRIGQFLDQFIADPDPSARLDFLAYHQYLTPRQAEPDLVNDEGAQLRRMLAERGLDPALPVHVNENGVFPTNQGTTDIAGDLLTQATGCLALYRRYADQPGVRAYHWTWFHPNPRKNAFVPTPQRLARQRDSANRPDDPVRQVLQAHTHPTPDAFTPFGHALSLLARLSGERVRVEASPRNEAGLGIDAIASRDERTVTILVWDYSFTQREAPECRALTVEIDVDRPVSSARIERVDSGSGHYLGPHAAPLVDAAAVREIAPGRFSVCTTIPRNAICWIALDLG